MKSPGEESRRAFGQHSNSNLRAKNCGYSAGRISSGDGERRFHDTMDFALNV